MAQGHRFKSEWPRLCRARLDRIRVDLAGFAEPSRNGRYLRILLKKVGNCGAAKIPLPRA